MPDQTPSSDITDVQPAGAGQTGLTGSPGHPGVAGSEPPAAEQTAAAPTPPPPPPPPAAQDIPPAPAPAAAIATPEPKVMAAEWPCPGYSGPQPWEAENPPALTQNHLMVSSGSAGPEVVAIAALLAHLGYGTSISAGENPHAIYDTGVSEAVRKFCVDYGVAEDPQVRAARTDDTVGPWLWEALVRAVHKKLAAQEA